MAQVQGGCYVTDACLGNCSLLGLKVGVVEFACGRAVGSWSLAVILVSRDVVREICRGEWGGGKDEHSFAEGRRPRCKKTHCPLE